MKRTAIKRRKRLNPVSKKTRTVRWPALKKLRAHVMARAGRECECPEDLRGGHWGPLDTHHVVKRSQGGKDVATNAVLLCRRHHDMTDWPTTIGRLVVTHLADERFYFHVFRL